MPRIKSAKKKLRVDLRRRRQNRRRWQVLKKAIKETKDQPTLSLAFKQIDKAAKRKLIHRRKAARLKAQLSQRFNKSSV